MVGGALTCAGDKVSGYGRASRCGPGRSSFSIHPSAAGSLTIFDDCVPPFGHISVDGIGERMIGYVQPPDDNRGRATVKASADAGGEARIRCGATLPSGTYPAVPKSGGRILSRSKLVLAR